MTDHKMNIKIEASYMGLTKKVEMHINYSADYSDVDSRVAGFFQDLVREGRLADAERNRATVEKFNQERVEHFEKIELQRLKAKYE